MRVKLSRKLFKSLLIVPLVIAAIAMVSLTGCGGSNTRGWSGVVPANGSLYVGGMDGSLYAINDANGTRTWSTVLEQIPERGFFSLAPAVFTAIYSTPAVDGNQVFAGSYMLKGSEEQGHIFGLSAENGNVNWVYPAQGSFAGTVVGGLAAADGLVYAPVTDGSLYALEQATGAKKWAFETGDQVWSTPVVSNGTVYFGSMDKNLYALDAATGAEKWHYETDGAVTAPVLVSNGTVYVGSYNRHFYAIDAANGSLKWDFTTDKGFWAAPVINGKSVFIPSLDGKVYVVDAGTGRLEGTGEIDDYVSSSPAVVGDSVMIASPQGNLYLMSAGNFNSQPFTELKSTVYAPLASSEGTVYIHSWSPEQVYAIDATGKQRWNPFSFAAQK